jgi:uncharacterized protein (DUF433 family)
MTGQTATRDLRSDARAIAFAAELGIDPETLAPTYDDLTPKQLSAAVRLAHSYGLSREAEWAGDFLYAHKRLVS